MSRLPALAPLLLLAASPLGCAPEIGDECKSSVDCSQQGDRLCDTKQPGGYCTIFNCEPDTCPEDDGMCVAFGHQLDPACSDDGRWARFERTFCMKECEDDGDCRDGYVCIAPEERAAVIIDKEKLEERVCMAKVEVIEPDPAADTPQVCGSGAGGWDWTPYEPGTGGAGGAGGAGGSGGSGGSGGAGGAGGG